MYPDPPSDFASRNAAPCEACQVCTFTKLAQHSVIRRTSIQDILSGDECLPFTSRTDWSAIQAKRADLQHNRAHLQQGTCPSKKLTNVKDVKRYLHIPTIAKNGLLIIKRKERRVHYRPSTGIGRTTNSTTHPAQPPVLSSTQSCQQALPVCPRHGQGHRPCDSSLSPLRRLMPNPESAHGAVILPSTQCRWCIFHSRCHQALKSARAGTTGMRDLVPSHDPAGGRAPPLYATFLSAFVSKCVR